MTTEHNPSTCGHEDCPHCREAFAPKVATSDFETHPKGTAAELQRLRAEIRNRDERIKDLTEAIEKAVENARRIAGRERRCGL